MSDVCSGAGESGMGVGVERILEAAERAAGEVAGEVRREALELRAGRQNESLLAEVESLELRRDQTLAELHRLAVDVEHALDEVAPPGPRDGSLADDLDVRRRL